MNKYFLFIDTEATGLPKNWSLPYANDANWPHAVQVSWLIFDENRTEIKRENHFIRNDGFTISDGAIKIHGITPEFLSEHGEDRAEVLNKLAEDIAQYDPLVVGHFILLDYHVLSAGYHRAGIKNPLEGVPLFCTMVASGSLSSNTMNRQLHLGELYLLLFYRELRGQHNAMVDAQATAECFFELMGRGAINWKSISEQNNEAKKWRDPGAKRSGCSPILLLVFISGLIIYFIST